MAPDASTAAVAPAGPASTAGTGRRAYAPRQPETTVLYRIVHEHLDEFLAHTRETYERPLPHYVVQALRKYLDCGVLSRSGFSRVRCPRCKHEFLVGLSCKGRSICPSCCTRRMTAAAVHMADRVFPDQPVRQWVLSIPWELRMLLAVKAPILSAVLRIFLRVVTDRYKRIAKESGVAEPQSGNVAFVQRFGASVNTHVHFHVLFVDGAFAKTNDGAVMFDPARPPSQLEIAQIAAVVGRRVKRMLRRRGLIREDAEADESDGGLDVQSAIDACLEAGLSPGTFERLDESAKVGANEEGQDDDARFDHRKRSPWAAEADGFSVHAGVHISAGDAEGRERLIRYCARPALSLERLSIVRDGRIAYLTKYPGRGGKTHRVMAPMEFMARTAALIPPPRHPTIRYSGVLTPASKWRPLGVPQRARASASRCEHKQRESGAEPHVHAAAGRPPRPSQTTAGVKPIATGRAGPVTLSSSASSGQRILPTLAAQSQAAHFEGAPAGDKHRGRRSTAYIDWPSLMLRSFNIDVLECPRCRARMAPIAVITEREVIETILTHLRLPLEPEVLSDGHTVAYDMTGEPMLDGDLGPDPAEHWERGPPPDRDAWDGIAAPSPEP
jgi:hypothetical protein